MSNLIIVVGSFKYGIVFIKFVMEKSGQAKCIQEERNWSEATSLEKSGSWRASRGNEQCSPTKTEKET